MEIKKEEFIKKNEAMCQEFGKNPYFEPEMVVGKPWRIYYTWNMRMETKCIDMKFKHATPMVSWLGVVSGTKLLLLFFLRFRHVSFLGEGQTFLSFLCIQRCLGMS